MWKWQPLQAAMEPACTTCCPHSVTNAFANELFSEENAGLLPQGSREGRKGANASVDKELGRAVLN